MTTPKESIEMYTLGCPEVLLPLHPILTPEQAITEARSITLDSFETEAGKAQYRDFINRGYHLIYWPDGTRAAVKKPNGEHLSCEAGVMVYLRARHEIEARVAAVMKHQGEA